MTTARSEVMAEWRRRIGVKRETRLGTKEGGQQGKSEKNVGWYRVRNASNAKLKEKVTTSHPRIAHGKRYPMPCLE